jgi:hypothetical protein
MFSLLQVSCLGRFPVQIPAWLTINGTRLIGRPVSRTQDVIPAQSLVSGPWEISSAWIDDRAFYNLFVLGILLFNDGWRARKTFPCVLIR